MNVVKESEQSKKKVVKAEIPWELYQAIIEMQARKKLDFNDACLEVSLLIDPNTEAFLKAAHAEAVSMYNSEFMKQLNMTRENIRRKAFLEGMEYCRRSRNHFYVPCMYCHEPMLFSGRDSNWSEIKTVLYNAFGSWHHTSCGQEREGEAE